MAAKGKISSVLDQQAIQSEIAFLEGKLTGILGQFKTIAVSIDDVNNKMKSANGGQSVNQTIQQQNVLVKSAANAMSEYDKAQKALNQTQERYNYLMNGGAKLEQQLYEARNRNKQKQAEIIAQNKQQTKTIEEQIAAAKRQKNSIAEVEAENKKLIAIKKQLNTDDKQQAAALKTINTRLDENTKYLRENGDAATKQRMNIGNYKDAWNGVKGALGSVAAALGITTGAMALIKGVIQATDTVSDKFTETQYAMNAAFDYTKKALATLDFTDFWNGLARSAAAGRDLAKALDDIEERGMAVGIIQAKNNIVIEKYNNISRMATLGEKQRLEYAQIALDKSRENNELNKQQASDFMNAQLNYAAALTGLDRAKVESLILDRQYNKERYENAQQVSEALSVQASTFTNIISKDDYWYVKYRDASKIVKQASQEQIDYSKQVGALGKLNGEQQKTLTDAVIGYYDAVSEYDRETGRLQMREAKLRQGILEDEETDLNKFNNAVVKSTDNKNQYLLEAQRRYQEAQINLIDDAETQEKARIELKYQREFEGLVKNNTLTTDGEKLLLAERDKELTAITVKYATERAKKEQEALQKHYSEIESQIRFGGATNEAYNQLEQIQQLKDLATKYGTDIAAATPEQSLAITEKYEQDKTAIVEKYEKQRLEMAVKTMELLAGMYPEDLNIQKELLSAKIALNQAEVSAEEEKVKAKVDANKEGAKQISEIDKALYEKKWDIVYAAYDAINSVVSSYYENEFNKIDEKAKKDETAKEQELERVEGNAELTEAVNKKYEQYEKKREKEKQLIAEKQARFEKISALFSIALSTAKGVMEALSNPLTAALVPYIVAMGALQAVSVAAQPIPKYFKGGKNIPGGLSEIGEQGTELIKTKDGKMFLTPDKPTYAYLPEGSDVIPNNELMRMLERSSITSIPEYKANATSYSDKELKAINGNISRLIGVMDSKPIPFIDIKDGELRMFVQRGRNITRYLDKNVRLNGKRT